MNKRMVVIGQRIREIREAKGWSQRYLSAKCGGDPSPKTISNLETANLKRSTTVETLERVASALGVDLWELFVPDEGMAQIALAYMRANGSDRDTLRHVADLASRNQAR